MLTKSWRRPASALLGLGVVAAVAAVTIARWLYPLGSINHDEPMYAFDARLLLRGHVTLPASFAPFRPWASGVRDGRLVPKYAPIWPFVLAVGQRLGSMHIGTAVTAAAAVILIGRLGRDLFGRWTEGLLAAGFLLLSPLFLLQTGTYLPYVFQLALDLAVALLVLQALQRWPVDTGPSRGVVTRLVAAGAVWGVALFARPYDALLLAVPITGGVIAATWRRPSRFGRAAGWTVLGAVVPVAALLAYDNALMGGPLRSTFSVTGPNDKLGFGARGVFRSSTFDFSAGDARVSFVRNLAQLPGWAFGGVLLVLLAAFGLWRHRRRGPAIWTVAGVAASCAVGYAFFWSPYSIVELWPGSATMGPFYHLPVLIALALLGAAGLAALADRSRVAAIVGVFALVVVTLVSFGVRIDRNRDVTRQYRAVQRLVDNAHLTRAILFVDDRGERGFESAAPFLENRPSLRQHVIYALDDGANDFAVMARFANRTATRMRTELRPGDQLLAPTRFVERLHVEHGTSVSLRFRIVNTVGAATVRATIRVGSTERSVVVDSSSERGATYDVAWRLRTDASAGRVRSSGIALPDGSGSVQVEADFGGAHRAPDRYRLDFPYQVDGGQVRVLGPGVGRYLFQYGTPTWLNQYIGTTLAERR